MRLDRGTLLLIGLLVAHAVLHVVSVGADGHWGDVRIQAGWAERMAEVGPLRFYEASGSVYPVLLYPLWLLGALLDGEALSTAVKGLALPFSLAIGVLLFAILRPRAGVGVALLGAALYLLNPATFLAGPVWGQVDAAGALADLGALVALGAGRHGLAGALAVTAAMVKPQFGLVLLPVVAVAAIRWWRDRSPRPAFRTGVGMAAAYAVIAAPLLLDPLRYLAMLRGAATQQPQTSLNAFNPWGLLVGFDLPDGPYVGIGAALLAIGVLAALSGLRRGRDLATVLAVGALLALAFYFLPTRVHERYLFPALALLAPLAVAGRAALVAYVALSLGFAGSLLYALEVTTPFDLPSPWDGWLLSDTGVWGVGLLLIGSAIAWAWRIGIRRPRLPGAADGPAP